MFIGVNRDQQKNFIILAVLIIISIVSSIYIAKDYQSGLVFVFWICIAVGMAAYLLKNLTNTEKLFYVFVFMIPLMNIIDFSYKYILPLGGIFLIFFVQIIVQKKINLKNIICRRNGKLLIAYFLLNLIILPYSIDKSTSLTYLLSFPFIILIWDWAAQHFNNRRKAENVIKLFSLIGTVYSVIGITMLVLNYLGVDISIHLTYTKVRMYEVSSVFPNTNTLGLLLSFTVPCAFYLFLENRDRFFYLICSVIMGVNLLLTFSRSSWGATAIAVAIIFFFKFRKVKLMKVLICVGCFAAFMFLIEYIPNLQLGSEKSAEGIFALSGRGILWDAAYRAILDRPLTGFGIGNSVSALNMYSLNILGRTPHNTYLRMWVEMGIFGLLIYLLFVYNIFRGFFRMKNKNMLLVTVFAVIAGSLFQQIFETMLLGGLSMAGAYFFVFSALFESMTEFNEELGGKNEDMLFG